MSIPALTLREMVVSVLQGNNEQPLKPSEIAAVIKERYPDYCVTVRPLPSFRVNRSQAAAA